MIKYLIKIAAKLNDDAIVGIHKELATHRRALGTDILGKAKDKHLAENSKHMADHHRMNSKMHRATLKLSGNKTKSNMYSRVNAIVERVKSMDYGRVARRIKVK